MIKKLLRSFAGKPNEAETLPPPDLSRIFPDQRRPTGQTNAHSPAGSAIEPRRPTGDTGEDATSDAADFSDWLAGDIEQLRDNFKALMALPTAPSRIRALFLTAHNLRGTAEPYGYPVIGRICTSLCRLLETVEDASEELALINLHVEAASAAARSGGSEAGDELAETVCLALEQKVARHGAGG